MLTKRKENVKLTLLVARNQTDASDVDERRADGLCVANHQADRVVYLQILEKPTRKVSLSCVK